VDIEGFLGWESKPSSCAHTQRKNEQLFGLCSQIRRDGAMRESPFQGSRAPRVWSDGAEPDGTVPV
jgi:hypothetical protein